MFVVDIGSLSQDEDSDYSHEASEDYSIDDIISLQRDAPMLLTMPQEDPSLPPRPEFPLFTIPYLGDTVPYDGGDLAMYPERHNWVIYHQDDRCDHPLCAPGICCDTVPDELGGRSRYYREHGPISPMLSRTDNAVVTGTSKAAFLQSWLFFGTLHEVSNMCGTSIDVQAEFLIDDGRRVSTASLNGLAARWFSSLRPEEVGDEAFMGRIITLGRRMVLLIAREVSSRPGGEPVFQYTFDEALVFFSINLLIRVISLHLLLHARSPSITRRRGEFYARLIEDTLIDTPCWMALMQEGSEILNNISMVGERSHGWCKTELRELDLRHFATVIDRPLARDHSACEDTIVCGAYQVDEATYQGAHTDGCSRPGCSPVEVNAKDLTEILGRGEIPVVSIVMGREDLDLKLEVVTGGFEHPYTAISHVCE